MADHCCPNLLGAMDRLWFHQIILLPDPISLLYSKNFKITQSIPETPPSSSSDLSLASPSEEEAIPSKSSPTPPQVVSDDGAGDEKQSYEEERPTCLSPTTSEIQSQSSSPSTEKVAKHVRYSGAVRRLKKTMSCKSLRELEYEEVKGFMDLGFKFEKEHLSPRMMSVVPGLQRLDEFDNQQEAEFLDAMKEADEDEVEEDEENSGVMRPYLSESWLVQRPDSPLLNLRLPPVSSVADMKKHLRFWAITVASVIQQEPSHHSRVGSLV